MNFNNTYKELSKNLVAHINRHLEEKTPVVIAIDGPCASGKSTMAMYLSNIFDAAIIKIDAFFLPEIKKSKERLAEPGGNFDYERFNKDVILKINNNEEIIYQPFNCKTQLREKEVKVKKGSVIIIEGVYCLREEFRGSYDISVFMDVSYDEQISRLKTRNLPMFNRFVNEFIPMEEKYFSTFNIKNRSNFIIKT